MKEEWVNIGEDTLQLTFVNITTTPRNTSLIFSAHLGVFIVLQVKFGM